MQNNSRRNFLKKLTLSSLSLPLTKLAFGKEPKQQGHRIREGDMHYRRLGRTGMKVSEISLGGSPLPDWALMLQIVERGVNYIDTSHTYSNGNSERQIGKLFKEVGRDKVQVGTKFHLRKNWDEESIIRTVEGSLQRLQTDYIDVSLIHGAENEKELTDERLQSAYSKLKTSGKIRFTGLSCHSNQAPVLKTAVSCGLYDMVQLGYNVFDIEEGEKDIKTYPDYMGESGLRDLLSLAAAKDIGIIAMKTLKVGGKRQDLAAYRTGTTSIFQAMLKWALENKNIASVVTEMLNGEQMDEDLAVPGQMLSEQERRNLFHYVAENSRDYCHMCGECQTNCPAGIKTTAILRCLAYYENYAKPERARQEYAVLKPGATSGACRNCGTCESTCAYNVAIRKRIRYAHKLLG